MVQWYGRLQQPDCPHKGAPYCSCCGEADAYWADEVHVEHDAEGRAHIIAVITDDRDDAPLRRLHEEVGARYEVPPNKIVSGKGNPTGHVVIFLALPRWEADHKFARRVLCYIMNGGV